MSTNAAPSIAEALGAETVDGVYRALSTAHDGIEGLVWLLARSVESGAADASSIEPVTFEQIGVIASVIADIDRHRDDLEEFRRRLADGIDGLSAIRSEQALRVGGASGGSNDA